MPLTKTPACRAAPERAQGKRGTWSLALVVICLGYFLVILDTMVVNVALPTIGRELHGGITGLQWVVDGYTLAFAGLLLAGGALAERLGARPVFVAGLAAFALASAACGLAPALPVPRACPRTRMTLRRHTPHHDLTTSGTARGPRCRVIMKLRREGRRWPG